MRLFYDPNINPTSPQHTLSEEESKHIIKVLRQQTGDQIGLLDGKGSLFTTEIIEAHPKKCVVKLVNQDKEPKQDLDIHIVVAPTKQNERIEWFVEKATEIGLTELTLMNCANSERNRIKIDRLEKKAVSAMKQSNRKFLPKINELTDFNSFVIDNPNGLIAHCYELEKNDFNEVFQVSGCPILIGPEGDFTDEEIAFAIENGYKTVTLGKNRLRTETAALYACMKAKIISE